jgi:hypothetical protein
MIEKLTKEFEKIRVSLTKSKKLIVADIDKIDEKYRRLAQEEKRSLTESLAVLNEQLKYYDKMLGNEPVQEELDTEEREDFVEIEPAVLPEPKEEKEAPIEDTIFPENNEPEQAEEKSEESERKILTKDDIVAGLEAAGIVNIDTVAENTNASAEEWPEPIPDPTDEKPVEKKEVDVGVLAVDDSGWPEFPDDWK